MENHEYLFIGAGLANLAAGKYLLDNNIEDFLLVERGRHLNQRKCPTASQKRCIQCSSCVTSEGLGGANSLHGNKLCYFPASSACLEYMSDDQLGEASRFLDENLFPYFDSNLSRLSQLSQREAIHSRFQKFYYSDVISLPHFREMVKRLYDPLIDSGKIRLATQIDHIDYKGGYYRAYQDGHHILSARNIVVGTGRSIHGQLLQSLRKLGVEFSEPKPDFGVRIEAKHEVFTERYNYQIDPKFKIRIEGVGDARTFCAHNKGVVVPVQFGNTHYADGAFGNQFTDSNNIALMTRVEQEMSQVEVQNWCGMVNNSIPNRSLFIANVRLDDGREWVAKLRGSIPQLPSSEHELLMDSLFDFIFEEGNSIISNFQRQSDLSVYGPAIDRYWDIPKIRSGFESSCDRVFFLGDSNGRSRGYVQALTTGVGWAIDQLNSPVKNQVESEQWRILA